MTSLESNVYALWARKQSTKGTPATVTGAKAFIQVGGDFSIDRNDGSEAWSDLERFGSQTDFVDTLQGAGNPVIEGQPEPLAFLLYLYMGGETVTAGTLPDLSNKHAFAPNVNGGFLNTWWVRVGQNVIRREQYYDCKIAGLTIEASTGSKVLHATPNIVCLSPAGTYAVANEPTGVVDKAQLEQPFLYTDGTGSYEVNDVVMTGQSQFSLTMDDALAPYYGDDVIPLDFVSGNPTIGVACTLLVDSLGMNQYWNRIFNTSPISTAVAPTKFLEAIGKYEWLLNATARNGGGTTHKRIFQGAIQGVRWSPDVNIPPNPDGGATELSLSGAMRKVTGQNAIDLSVNTDSAAFV